WHGTTCPQHDEFRPRPRPGRPRGRSGPTGAAHRGSAHGPSRSPANLPPAGVVCGGIATKNGPMRAFQNRPRLRWLVPIVAVTALVAGGLVAGTAAAEPSLPEQSAEQLVAKVAASRPTQFSGTAETRADLGLPELPGSRRGSDFEALLSGENTIRVWVGTEQQTRVAVHGTFGESDLVRDGSDVWLWNSRERTAVHSKVTGGKDRSAESAPTPQQLAAQAIEAIEPTTRISVARNVTVAGRAAYELVLEPKDDRSLI